MKLVTGSAVLLLASSAVSLPLPSRLIAQAAPCTFTRGIPNCNQSAFQRTWAAAHVVSYNKSSLDAVASKELFTLLTALGKQVLPASPHSDLVFELTEPDTSGVFVGPSGVERARLRVYGPGLRGPLLWEEVYQDQPDVPWPSAVLYLLERFRARFPLF